MNFKEFLDERNQRILEHKIKRFWLLRGIKAPAIILRNEMKND